MISAKQAYEAAAAPISREVRDAFAVVEPHMPRPVGCEDLPSLGDELWLRREHGNEWSRVSASSKYPSSSILRRSGRGWLSRNALQRRTLLGHRCPDLANAGAILEPDRVAAKW